MSNRLIKTVANLGEVTTNEISMANLFSSKVVDTNYTLRIRANNHYTTTNLFKIEHTALNNRDN